MDNFNYLNEEWRNIKGYEGKYQISNYGRVKSIVRDGRKTEKILKQTEQLYGYLQVVLSKNGKIKCFRVNRLVAFAFPEICGEWFEGAECNHINEIKTDNRAENLEWITHIENINFKTAQKRKSDKISRTILQYDLEGKFIREWKSAFEVKKILGYSQGNIRGCCLGEYGRKTAYGYIWKFKEA